MNTLTTVIALAVLMARSFRADESQVDEVNTDSLLQVFNRIEKNIQTTFPQCTQLNHILGLKSSMLNNLPNAVSLQHGSKSRDSVSAVLNIDLSPTANNIGDSYIRYVIENKYFFKYHQPCSVVLDELDHSLLDNTDRLNNATVGQRWPERILPLLPNKVQNTFFIFFTSVIPADPEQYKSKVNQLMHETSMILHSAFVIPEEMDIISVLKGLPRNSQGDLKLISTYHSISNEFAWEDSQNLFYKMYTNFHADAAISLFCIVCRYDGEVYKRTGIARNNIAVSWHEVHEKFNLTSVREEIFGVPNTGVKLNEENPEDIDMMEYDDFLLPVVDGTAALSTLIITSPYIEDVVYSTRPYFYDAMCFITGPPKQHRIDSIFVLREPLDDPVWIGFAISFFAVILTIEVFMYNGKGKRRLLQALAATFRPVLDQSGAFTGRVKSSGVKAILGTWLFALIVLGSGYKSKLVSTIVIPHYDYPPRTFVELEKSDYKIGAIYYHKVLHDFTVFNTTVNVNLMKRASEIDFLGADCYQMVFEGGKACLGYMTAFRMVGLKYMIDVKGRSMYFRSKDTHFSGRAVTAISKFYPMLLEPLEFHLGSLDMSGIPAFLHDMDLLNTRKLGMAYAKRNVDTLEYYKGFDNGGESNDDKVIIVVLEILKFGLTSSAFLFVLELLYKFSRVVGKVYQGSRGFPEISPEGLQRVYARPLVYENEFYLNVKQEKEISIDSKMTHCRW